MAKAIAIILLLAATAAIAAASPNMIGKGGGITVTKTTATADSGSGSGDKGGCKCKEDCENVEKKACREVEVEKEVCKDEDKVIEEVICVKKCVQADKVISIGKGRHLFSTNIVGKGASKAVTISKDGGAGSGAAAPAPAPAQKQQQEVCRDVCNPERRTVKDKVCKKVKNTERVDCRVISVTPVCAKSCECGFIGGKGKGH